MEQVFRLDNEYCTSPIVCVIYGGLGNQLFQFAAGLSLSKRLKRPLVLDTSWFSCIPSSQTKRTFDLPSLLLLKNIRSQHAWPDLFLDNQGIMNILRKANAKVKRRLNRVSIFTESDYFSTFTFNSDPSRTTLLMLGYWQSLDFFSASVVQDIRDMIKPLRDPSNLQVLSSVASANSVCIHVRSGDYLSSEMHGVCGELYFRTAIDYMNDALGDPVFYFFSDDSEWVKQTFSLGRRFVLVDINDSFNAHKDLVIMRACNHFIISNSTLGLWAAYLQGKSDKVVVAPRTWFASSSCKEANLVPSDWIRL